MQTDEHGIITFDDKSKLFLMDLSKITPYVDFKSGRHLKQQKLSTLNIDYMFSSLDAVMFKSTSRKDDLVSLCNLMIFMLNGGKLPLFDLPDSAKNHNQRTLYFCQIYKK